jgi:hypothetical protein
MLLIVTAQAQFCLEGNSIDTFDIDSRENGDVDTVVPLERNSGLVAERYRALGGEMELVVPNGQGHNMWEGFFRSTELVAFVKRAAGR